MLTPETLTTAFNEAGIDTPEKVVALLTMAGAQMRRAAAVLALDALNAKQATAIAGINAEREAIQRDITTLSTQIVAAVTPQ